MLRWVPLPPEVRGRLYLSAMPGRYGAWTRDQEALFGKGTDLIVALTSLDEIRRNSPEYAQAIESGRLPWKFEHFPILDFGAPADRAAFLGLARSVAASLQGGENVVIHCGAGIGRTGTLAICVLLVLGVELDEARQVVKEAGSGPERVTQNELLEWVAAQR